jgi:hypothetical protein
MTNDALYAMVRQALDEIDASPPNRLPVKTLAAKLQQWEIALAVAEHELVERQVERDFKPLTEPLLTLSKTAINLQTQIDLGYQALPEAERQRLLASLELRHTNAVRAHTMRERHVNGPAQPTLAGLATLPKAS